MNDDHRRLFIYTYTELDKEYSDINRRSLNVYQVIYGCSHLYHHIASKHITLMNGKLHLAARVTLTAKLISPC